MRYQNGKQCIKMISNVISEWCRHWDDFVAMFFSGCPPENVSVVAM